MAVKNKWAILFAGIAGILSVWGYWGGGTAAGLLPERTRISRFLPPVERPLMDSPREEWTAEAAKSMMPRFTGVKDR